MKISIVTKKKAISKEKFLSYYSLIFNNSRTFLLMSSAVRVCPSCIVLERMLLCMC